MQEIDFEDGKTSISAATFNAFQKNIKDAFIDYKVGKLIINTDVVKDGTISYVSVSKDESNTVQLNLTWSSSFNLQAGKDYIIAYLPQEFRPKVDYIYGGCRAEKPIGVATFVIAQEDGRIVVTANQASTIVALSTSYKAEGGNQV